jgi:hypothetical protein
MDRAVIAAYGWGGMEVPPYVAPASDDEATVAAVFGEDVIGRISALNVQRAEEELLRGTGKRPAGRGGRSPGSSSGGAGVR